MARTIVMVLTAGIFALAGSAVQAEEMMLTGSIGDAMCGVKHAGANAVGCTKGCVKKGSAYALIVDDKAYTLKTSGDEMDAQLDALAGQMATITGDVMGTDITVTSVKAAG